MVSGYGKDMILQISRRIILSANSWSDKSSSKYVRILVKAMYVNKAYHHKEIPSLCFRCVMDDMLHVSCIRDLLLCFEITLSMLCVYSHIKPAHASPCIQVCAYMHLPVHMYLHTSMGHMHAYTCTCMCQCVPMFMDGVSTQALHMNMLSCMHE